MEKTFVGNSQTVKFMEAFSLESSCHVVVYRKSGDIHVIKMFVIKIFVGQLILRKYFHIEISFSNTFTCEEDHEKAYDLVSSHQDCSYSEL